MRKWLLMGVLLLTWNLSFAALSIPGLPMASLNALAASDPTLAQTGITSNEDDIIAEQNMKAIVLTEGQKHEGKVWRLTEDEELRYVQLMQNRSGIYYQGRHLTPVDILGINARNEAERRHFAELAAKQEAQKVAQNIAWNNAFYKAYNELFSNVPVVGDFNAAIYSPVAYKPLALQADDALYLFVKPTDAVQTILLMLIDAIDTTPNTHLHILFLGADDIAIQLWANQHQLPRALVDTSRISLNHGERNFEALGFNKPSPLLLRVREGVSTLIDLGKF
jgi:integrating conjugative element protein (TIGR03759 family)